VKADRMRNTKNTIVPAAFEYLPNAELTRRSFVTLAVSRFAADGINRFAVTE
jgi:hypothetical protein